MLNLFFELWRKIFVCKFPQRKCYEFLIAISCGFLYHNFLIKVFRERIFQQKARDLRFDVR